MTSCLPDWVAGLCAARLKRPFPFSDSHAASHLFSIRSFGYLKKKQCPAKLLLQRDRESCEDRARAKDEMRLLLT